ncbi:MAG: hypothetical protein KA714_16215 [Limnoraphis sp. WC205]|jgi:hypothetical protein|nr:hypothetical protein [Limnoraphis sp. WC205]
MKMIKLMTVTALTVGAVFGTIVESAVARGGRWSGSNTNDPSSDFEFSIFTQTPDGEPILDSSGSIYAFTRSGLLKRYDRNPNLGNFEGAIRNFSFTANSDILGFQVSGSYDILDLRARKIDANYQELIYNYETREYDLVTPELVEYSFLLPGTDYNIFSPYIFGFSFELPLDGVPEQLDPVNSIEDIFTLFNLRDDDGELLVQSLLPIDINSVSEPSLINSLLAIGIFGTGFALRRKFQKKYLSFVNYHQVASSFSDSE